MEILALLLIVVILVILLSGYFKTHVLNPSSLHDNELEDSFIELKKLILVTSAYDAEKTYEKLYDRLTTILAKVIERHRHFALDIEARKERLSTWSLFLPQKHHTSEGLPYTTYAVPADLPLESLEPDVLLYLCFFLYLGGIVKDVGTIDKDTDLMMKILDYLISEKDYMPARFFKGLVLKYGIKIYQPSNLPEARILLETAATNGVGAASIELRRFDKFRELDGIKSIHG